MDFKTEMAERTAQIEQIIKKYLPKEEGYQKTIMEAMNYSVLREVSVSADADAGDFTAVWRKIRGDRTVHGSDRDDSHLLTGA